MVIENRIPKTSVDVQLEVRICLPVDNLRKLLPVLSVRKPIWGRLSTWCLQWNVLPLSVLSTPSAKKTVKGDSARSDSRLKQLLTTAFVMDKRTVASLLRSREAIKIKDAMWWDKVQKELRFKYGTTVSSARTFPPVCTVSKYSTGLCWIFLNFEFWISWAKKLRKDPDPDPTVERSSKFSSFYWNVPVSLQDSIVFYFEENKK